MYHKFKNIFFISIFLFSLFFVTKHYFSEKNIVETNRSRSSYLVSDQNLPLLKNDTNNIIIFRNDVEEYKKKSKKRFWEKLISNEE